MPRRNLTTACALTAALAAAGCASSLRPVGLSGALPAGDHAARVDELAVIVDSSQSMAEVFAGQSKQAAAQGLARSLAWTIPELGYRAALRTFGRAPCLAEGDTALLWGPEVYSQMGFARATYRLECSGGPSTLEAALAAAGSDFRPGGKGKAVVVLSDGRFIGEQAVAAARELKAGLSEELCISTILVGDSREGESLLQRLVEAGGCGVAFRASDLGDPAALGAFVERVLLDRNSDADGVPDRLDLCPDTPAGVPVDSHGCPLDSDGDGVSDNLDTCPGTAKGVPVDASGCPRDSDRDGVTDDRDTCPGTPRGVKVNATGCPNDTDRDGVPDAQDKCPGTPRTAKVDASGCPPDSDGDGVRDDQDVCPDTPANAVVDATGCPVQGIERRGDTWVVPGEVLFDLDRADLKPGARKVLDVVLDQLAGDPALRLEIGGHCDQSGSVEHNRKLSERRAIAARDYLVGKGVQPDRLQTRGYGFSVPVAPNDSPSNRARNRRVELKPLR